MDAISLLSIFCHPPSYFRLFGNQNLIEKVFSLADFLKFDELILGYLFYLKANIPMLNFIKACLQIAKIIKFDTHDKS
jgi:hypothetical protein